MDSYTKWVTSIVTASLLAMIGEKVGPKRESCDTFIGTKEISINKEKLTVYRFSSREGSDRSFKTRPGLYNVVSDLIPGRDYCFTYTSPLSPLGIPILENIHENIKTGVRRIE